MIYRITVFSEREQKKKKKTLEDTINHQKYLFLNCIFNILIVFFLFFFSYFPSLFQRLTELLEEIEILLNGIWKGRFLSVSVWEYIEVKKGMRKQKGCLDMRKFDSQQQIFRSCKAELKVEMEVSCGMWSVLCCID